MLRHVCLAVCLGFLACDGSEQMQGFFERFGNDPSKLSSTQLVKVGSPVGRIGDWVKLLRVDTTDGKPEVVNINFRSIYSLTGPLVSPDGHTTGGAFIGGTPQRGSPLVARVRWGVGGVSQVIEFDIPAPRDIVFQPQTYPNTQNPVTDSGNGISVCFTGSSFEVQVRHDGADFSLVAGSTDVIGNTSPALVSAFITPGTGANVMPIRRDLYLVAAGGTVLAAGANVKFFAPSFARRVWFPRNPINNVPLTYLSNDTSGPLTRTFDIPVNSEGPFEIYNWEQVITLTNGGGVNIQQMWASFDCNPS